MYVCNVCNVCMYEEGVVWGFNRVTIQNSKLYTKDFLGPHYLINAPTLVDPWPPAGESTTTVFVTCSFRWIINQPSMLDFCDNRSRSPWSNNQQPSNLPPKLTGNHGFRGGFGFLLPSRDEIAWGGMGGCA